MMVVGIVVNLVTLPMIAHRFKIFIIVKKMPIMMMSIMMNTLRWNPTKNPPAEEQQDTQQEV